MLAHCFGRTLARAVGFLVLGIAASSQAVIVFSNVSITGTPSLISGASFVTSDTDIDFTFPNAIVGDFQVVRTGQLNITYEATSVNVPAMNQMIAIFLGGLSGSGVIQYSEVIEDMVVPGIIASQPLTTITSNSQLPFMATLDFLRPSTHIKVKKEIFLIAEPNTNALDFARVSLVEQGLNVVPEPASMAALGLGLAAVASRRRRK